LASPLAVVPTQPLASLGHRVAAQIGGRRPVGIIVGLPLDQRGQEADSARAARLIAETLEQALGLPVTFVDERFTTAEMAARRREAGRSRKQQRVDIDAWAAAAILQAWLDRQPAS
jgi:putative Holliday junction resolvase